MRCLLLILFAAPVLAQQMVIPEELDSSQARVFRRLAEAVSAPCCNNGAPVAYHDSGTATYIKDFIKDALLAGKGEAQIMAELEALELGKEKRKVIFTVPENNWLGWATWATPALIVALGVAAVFFFLSLGKKKRVNRADRDEALLAEYRERIAKRLGEAG